MNIFQCRYDERLKSWYNLRLSIERADPLARCVAIDSWWQFAPLENHYLHVDSMKDWPTPWELILENEYCTIARGLGMIYTLMLLGEAELDFVQAKDYNSEDVTLVVVQNQWILNYWPNTVITNKLSDFTNRHSINIDSLKEKFKST